MPDWLAIVLRPFSALVLFGAAALLAYLLRRFIPAGRIKSLLYEKHSVIPTSDEERKDWRPAVYLLGLVGAMLLLFWIIV